ncbi:MAG: urease accessory protein, partial [Actinobacteria bacterium]|nr:urease accessory protein [Actinomycetota bacterium]
MDALLLLLLDSRSPAGAHNHSAGMEAAVATGLVSDLAGVEAFCRARLRTAGRVAAEFAAAACARATSSALRGGAAGRHAVGAPAVSPRTAAVLTDWTELDAELDARTPSEAQRAASR